MQNIIVRMPNWIGDAVMATPILSDLRVRFPDASITAMCQGAVGEILVHDPAIDELFRFSKVRGFVRRIRDRDIVDRLQMGQYDLGVILPNSFSSAWTFWQGNVKRRLGYGANCRSFLLTDRVAFPEKRKEQHLVTTYKELLVPLGIPVSATPTKLFVTDAEVLEAHKKLGVEGRFVGINAGAAYGPAKQWLPERFREVAKRLLEDEETVVLFFGDESMVPLVTEISEGLSTRAINLAGTTSLREFMALLSLCDTFLTNDSGPMHIADALGTRTVALFGSTDPTVTGPYNKSKVIYKNVDCAPCFKRKCPIDFRCMKGISVDEVVEELCSKN